MEYHIVNKTENKTPRLRTFCHLPCLLCVHAWSFSRPPEEIVNVITIYVRLRPRPHVKGSFFFRFGVASTRKRRHQISTVFAISCGRAKTIRIRYAKPPFSKISAKISVWTLAGSQVLIVHSSFSLNKDINRSYFHVTHTDSFLPHPIYPP
jgi:hypothetical protein